MLARNYRCVTVHSSVRAFWAKFSLVSERAAFVSREREITAEGVGLF
jgi:hypothetical protein